MIKFEFKQDNHKLTMEIDDAASLGDVLELFEHFLKGSGYSFDGHIDVVREYEDDDASGTDS